jgi:MYXO-CTERM domain-containing protein
MNYVVALRNVRLSREVLLVPQLTKRPPSSVSTNQIGSLNMKSNLVLVSLVAAVAVTNAASASLRITEVMSSSNGNGSATPDWFEITNFGSSAISVDGLRMDDNSFSFAVSRALLGITSIGAGETVIFLETAAGAAVDSFRTFWGGLAGVQVGYYSGAGASFSSGGDGMVLFDATGSEISPRVEFGAATSGSSFFWGYDSAGNLDPAYVAQFSTVGTIGTQVGFASSGDIGSLGTAIGIPAPGALALVGLAGLVARRRR